MSKRNKGYTLIELLVSIGIIGILVLPIGLGWIQNIYKLTKCDFQAPYKSEVIRVIGIPVAPVGGIVGWMALPDTAPAK